MNNKESLNRRIHTIKSEIMKLNGCSPASLVDVYRKSDKKEFGPYKIAVFKESGKRRSKYLDENTEKIFKEKIKNYKKLKKLLSEWMELEMKATGIEINQSKTINSTRKKELRNDEEYIHIMKYMGSKRELLPDIKKEISKTLPEGGAILDLFAGTASVGAYLKNDYDVVSNDIQKYSSVLANALICSTGRRNAIDYKKAITKIKKAYLKNLEELESMLPKTLKKSFKFINLNPTEWDENNREEYVKFVESFPSPLNSFQTSSKELKLLNSEYKKRTDVNKVFPYLQTTALFSETYFSTHQAMQIDSLRYAIDFVFEDEIQKSVALSALIYAHSYTSSGTGHFAMFRDIKTVKSAVDVFKYRPKDALELFLKKLEELIEYSSNFNGNSHESWSFDYEEALSDENLINIDLVYADPPYSFVHYSRFYHATESLIKYDYYEPEFKGRYRTDRHQSPFCQKLNVNEAFTKMINKCAKNNVSIVISYSDTGMISYEEIKKIIKKSGLKFRSKEIDYDHSTLGRSGHKSNQIKEYLIIGEVKEKAMLQ